MKTTKCTITNIENSVRLNKGKYRDLYDYSIEWKFEVNIIFPKKPKNYAAPMISD